MHPSTPAAAKRARRLSLAAVAIVAVALAVAAGVILRQDIAVSPSVQAPDVIFANGADYAAINAAGYANLTVGSSGTSATLSVSGIAGVADLQLVDVMKITNQDLLQDYNLTLVRSAAPAAAISQFTVKVLDSGDSVVASWDAKASAQSSTFLLPADTTYDISIVYLVADGTSVGALTGFTVQVEIVPA